MIHVTRLHAGYVSPVTRRTHGHTPHGAGASPRDSELRVRRPGRVERVGGPRPRAVSSQRGVCLRGRVRRPPHTPHNTHFWGESGMTRAPRDPRPRSPRAAGTREKKITLSALWSLSLTHTARVSHSSPPRRPRPPRPPRGAPHPMRAPLHRRHRVAHTLEMPSVCPARHSECGCDVVQRAAAGVYYSARDPRPGPDRQDQRVRCDVFD